MQFKLFAAATLTTMMFLPGAALAECKQGICVSGHDEKDTHYVQLSTTLKDVTHWNLNVPGHGGQRELGAHETQFTIPLGHSRPVTIHYSLQACHKNPLGSSCLAWVNFEHTAKATAEGGGKLFVAVAGDEKGRWTISKGYPSAAAAHSAAMGGCGGCKILHENQARCVAVAAVPEGKPWAITSGENLEQVSIKAQQDCAAQAPGRCKHVNGSGCAGK